MSNINTPIVDCIPVPTTEQGNINYYYKLASSYYFTIKGTGAKYINSTSSKASYIASYINSAVVKESFGKEGSKDYYDYINNLYYLLLYISVIADERTIDVNNGIDNPCSTYADEFICIVNYFKCLNIDITPLLTIFGFTCTGGVAGPGGIGIMQISNNANLQEFVVTIPNIKLR